MTDMLPVERPNWLDSPAALSLLRAAGTSNFDAAVEKIVTELLADVHADPTDLDSLAEKLDVEVAVRAGLPVTGMLLDVHGRFNVVLAAEQPSPRRRFTLAHELAHVLLAHHAETTDRLGTSVEVLCDRIAEEILMPTALMRDVLAEDVAIRALFASTRRFAVSLRAMSVRWSRLTACDVFVADDKGLLWTTSAEPNLFNGILSEIVGTARAAPVRAPIALWRERRGEREAWLAEVGVHSPSGEVVLLLRPELDGHYNVH